MRSGLGRPPTHERSSVWDILCIIKYYSFSKPAKYGKGGNLSKVLILSPDYQVKFGHVGKSLELYAEYLFREGLEVELVVPIAAPRNANLERRFVVHHILPNIYESFLVPGFSFNYPGRRYLNFLANRFGGKWKHTLILGFQRLAWLQFYYRALRGGTKLAELLNELSSKDYVFFPSADNLVATHVLKLLHKKNRKSGIPKTVLRFINVLENIEFPIALTKRRLYSRLRNAQVNLSGLIVASETSTYKKHLVKQGIDTAVIHYPPKLQTQKQLGALKPNTPAPVISTLGSARPDKGYERLAEIIPQYLSLAKALPATFIVQGPARHWSYGSRFSERVLKQTRDVNLKPGILSDKKLLEYLSISNVNLLPYYQDVYEFRGSAMLYEACDFLVPTIAPAGTGFGEDVEKYDLGLTFVEFAEIPKLLVKLLSTPPDKFRRNIQKYNEARLKSLKDIFK